MLFQIQVPLAQGQKILNLWNSVCYPLLTKHGPLVSAEITRFNGLSCKIHNSILLLFLVALTFQLLAHI